MHRIYHHYEKWEDYQNRMYDEIKDGRKERVLLAIECLGNKEKCYNAMKMVVENWILACEHNLTNESSNRRAWVGQAACNIAYNVKEDETREAWGILTQEQRYMANKIADIVITEWEKKFLPTQENYQYELEWR